MYAGAEVEGMGHAWELVCEQYKIGSNGKVEQLQGSQLQKLLNAFFWYWKELFKLLIIFKILSNC